VRVNIAENIGMSVPGILAVLWFIKCYLFRDNIKGVWYISSLVFHAIFALAWIALGIAVWLYPGGHPPAAALVALFAVWVTLVASPISLILVIVAGVKTRSWGTYADVIITNLIVLGLGIYAALYIR
jgi:hypothetical protein